MYTQQKGGSANYILSANMPVIYQAIWTATSPDSNETYIPKEAGDVVNAVFKVYSTTTYPAPASYSDWDLIATIKKSRDLPNVNYYDSNVPNNQRFTVNIQQILADQLSYTLCPIGAGSINSLSFGGMNGGARAQDNITEMVSPYNLTRNGQFRRIVVLVNFEVLDSNLQIVTSTTTLGAPPTVYALNATVDFRQSNYFYSQYLVNEWGVSNTKQSRALTRCPNRTLTDSDTPEYKKPMLLNSQGEFLSFFVRSTFNGNHPADVSNVYEVYGKAFYTDGTDEDFVLGSTWSYPINNDPTNIGERIQSDLSNTFLYNSDTNIDGESYTGTSDTQFAQYQNNPAIQNVGAAYIDAHAYPPQDAVYPYTGTQFSPINHATKTCTHYYVHVRSVWYDNTGGAPSNTWQQDRKSSVYWYFIDDEQEPKAFPFVKFYWLNSMGGIDTYTAKRNTLESVSVQRTLSRSQQANKRYNQSNNNDAFTIKDYISQTTRGYDTYKGGLEVTSVDVQENNSVYTEPMNRTVSNWLSELIKSPNVWIEDSAEGNSDMEEYKNTFAYNANYFNDTLRPLGKIYKPVVITNSEVVTVDEEQGLVSFNIQYTPSYKTTTQRN
ncbi:MAG: hypothetical protein Unbinned8210contig1002_6 [Prokaryotic dsDNA virus sp.]|nr:MAG: hypothetical protein Unbinned8210contig1002_6 [Prokaryotic dsDNA virus sp.]